MADSAFPGLVTADWKFLDESSSRSQCPKCKRSRKYYCYSCCVPLPHLASEIPAVKLPVKVDIIKHPSETDGKSTAPHAVILAPDDVVIHTYPCIPDYDTEKVVLVFPGDQSFTLEELAADWPRKTTESSECEGCDSTRLDQNDGISQHAVSPDLKNEISAPQMRVPGSQSSPRKDGSKDQNVDDSRGNKRSHDHITRSADSEKLDEAPPKKIKTQPSLPFEKVVFIDSTWNQTHSIVSDERLKNLKKVELRTRNSNFWRHQEGMPETYLSTIEAIFYFFKDLHSLFLGSEYTHEYDNLLFFFCFIYDKIQKSSNRGRTVKDPRR